ncbi:MAG: efflux RND transporter periplasmic adaptor subunit [Thermoguttaceae bacterium]|nr:efflux RND transporter periplasmic adaptor subunit [Thermoguttaceae bacterium]
MPRCLSTLALCALLAVAASGCDLLKSKKNESGDKKPQEALKVSVVEPTTREIQDFEEVNGRTAAVESVDVRAQVSGYLEEICFQPGQNVKKGDVLFKLDDAVYAAVVAQRQADVERSAADVKSREAEIASQTADRDQALLDWNRQKELSAKNATSQQSLELAETAYNRSQAGLVAAQAELSAAQAEQQAAKANLARAQIDLDYATIKSPIDGVVSREQITVGNLVESGSTLLTSVVKVDPLYVFFDVDERTLQPFRLKVLPLIDKEDGFTVKFALGDEPFEREAKVQFNEPRLNETTGTLEFRAVADNKPNDNGTRNLLPGVRLRVLFPTSLPYQATIIPEEAILTDQNVKYVFTVDAENNAKYTPIKLGALQDDNMRVVLAGLEPGARVITDQLLKVRDGEPVEATVVENRSTTMVIREDGTFYPNDGGEPYQDELATTPFVGEGKEAPAQIADDAENAQTSEAAPVENAAPQSASETPQPQK